MLILYVSIAFLLLVFLAISLAPLMVYIRKTGFEKPRTDLWLFGIATLLSLMLAIFLYTQWGASQSLAKFYAMSEAASVDNKKLSGKKEIQQVTEKLMNYLNRHPKDAKGWYLLGRLYLDQNNVAKAVEAFKLSLANDPQNTELMVQYAQALYLRENHLSHESMHFVQTALSQDPQNVTALNLLAVDAFKNHRYEMAITYWKRLRNHYAEDSQEFHSLTKAINIAESKSKKG